MAKLPQIAAERGKASVQELMEELIEQHGNPLRIARDLGVAPNTVRWWLISNGYEFTEERKFRWVKSDPDKAG